MKLLLVHISGLATAGFEELGGRSLLEAAGVEALDEIARRGSCGTVPLLPEGVIGGPGWELLSLLGYAEEVSALPSLGALEATAIGAPLYARDVAFRVNLSSLDDSGVIADTSGDGVPTADALAVMETVDEKLSTRWLRFYRGRDAAHVMVWTDGPAGVQCVPAPLARGQALADVLPRGDGDGPLRQLIWDSLDLLSRHRVNHWRVGEGLLPVNLVWPWAPGLPPNLRHYALRTGLKAVALASRLEVVGAARAVGIRAAVCGDGLPEMRAALKAAGEENGIAYLHLDVKTLFEHPTEPEAHAQAVTRLDTELVGPLLNEVGKSAEAARLVVVGTWPDDGWQTRPPALWAAFPALRGRPAMADEFSEAALDEARRLGEAEGLLRESLAAVS